MFYAAAQVKGALALGKPHTGKRDFTDLDQRVLDEPTDWVISLTGMGGFVDSKASTPNHVDSIESINLSETIEAVA